MALVTVPGAGGDDNSLNLPPQDSSDLDGLFANSFQNLMNQAGLAEGNAVLGAQMQQDTISAAGNGPATRLSIDGAMNFVGGAGSPSWAATGSNATVYGMAHTAYTFGGSDTGGMTTFYTSDNGHFQPEDILFDASSSQKEVNAFAGLGDTIKGGSNANTITVHNTVGHGKPGGADLYSGGSGSDNLFQFLNNKGGQYTIHDFQQSAGNKVGLKASDKQIGDMLKGQQTVKGARGETDSIVNLPDDQGQITFQDVTQLNPKDFQKF